MSVCEKAPDAGSQSLMAWSAGSRLLAATKQCDASDDMARQDTLPGSLKLPTRSRLEREWAGNTQCSKVTYQGLSEKVFHGARVSSFIRTCMRTEHQVK